MPELEILYRDDHIVAVNKPVGMLVHRTKLATRVKRIAMRTLRKQLNQLVYSIHRLDRPTSGVLLFALSQEAARATCELFEKHKVEKEYLALARGYVDDEGTIDMPLIEHHDKMTDELADKDKAPQSAVTQYQTLARCEYPEPVGRYETARYSLVRLHPKTGRRHQIRRHLKHTNHPVIGDRKHGDRDHNEFFREKLGLDRMMLVAHRLTMSHPMTGEPLEFIAPPGEQFDRALETLGLG